MKKSSPYVMTSRQINIPYLLKIGEGKIAKIGKYLFDKDIVERMCNEWKETKEMLQYIDVIVDGKYEEDKKDMMLQFKGSSNQRTILVKESLESGNIVLLYD